MKREIIVKTVIWLILSVMLISLSSCTDNKENARTENTTQTESSQKGDYKMMKMKIDDTYVNVKWEDNESVRELCDMLGSGPISIEMSMYGGFEQVGDLPASISSEDRRISTESGDIMLYQSRSIVVFYGNNSYSYTRLGHVTDKNASELKKLLGNKDVTITLTREDE